MGYFRLFFTHSRLFTALYPTLCVKKKNYKKIVQITFYEKSKNFTVIVSQMRVLGEKTRGGGAKRPPPSLYRVKGTGSWNGQCHWKLNESYLKLGLQSLLNIVCIVFFFFSLLIIRNRALFYHIAIKFCYEITRSPW